MNDVVSRDRTRESARSDVVSDDWNGLRNTVVVSYSECFKSAFVCKRNTLNTTCVPISPFVRYEWNCDLFWTNLIWLTELVCRYVWLFASVGSASLIVWSLNPVIRSCVVGGCWREDSGRAGCATDGASDGRYVMSSRSRPAADMSKANQGTAAPAKGNNICVSERSVDTVYSVRVQMRGCKSSASV